MYSITQTPIQIDTKSGASPHAKTPHNIGGFLDSMPADWSCANTKSRKTRIFFSLAWMATFIALICAFPNQFSRYSLTVLQFFILFMAALRFLAIFLLFLPKNKTLPESPALWPRFTILVALYKESHMVDELMSNLSHFDYPPGKLQIFMVCEADDKATCRAVRAQLRPPFHLFEVPPSTPRTKPKALNAALAALPKSQIGEIITVYDAEDRPHAWQLKAAAIALQDPRYAAVQAPLGYYNDQQNLLTRFFALEYAALFHVWNPALARLGLPFTLGGTSNHIRRETLECAGGWDSHNVTEDADLSFRISALHRPPSRSMRIGCIGFGTEEQAVSTQRDWTHQRSRWLKGFMQTWAVHIRPKRAAPDGTSFRMRARIRNAVALHITVTATLLSAFLHVPSLIIISALALLNAADITQLAFPPSFFVSLGIGYTSTLLIAAAGAWKVKKLRLLSAILLLPLYWLLYFRAALIAAWEYVFAPNYWRKTTHVPLEAETTTPI